MVDAVALRVPVRRCGTVICWLDAVALCLAVVALWLVVADAVVL